MAKSAKTITTGDSIESLEGKEIKPNDLVEVFGTGKFADLPKDKRHVVHKVHAMNLEKKGFVTVGEEVEAPKPPNTISVDRKAK